MMVDYNTNDRDKGMMVDAQPELVHGELSHPGFGAPRPGREHNHQVC
jgi:hypothetical protein